MAQRLSISPSHVARIEAAQANVTIDTLDRIAGAFSVQTVVLLEPRSTTGRNRDAALEQVAGILGC